MDRLKLQLVQFVYLLFQALYFSEPHLLRTDDRRFACSMPIVFMVVVHPARSIRHHVLIDAEAVFDLSFDYAAG